jgi:methylmalonyl-CoA/ethylmalonyl-CoA epimerase
MATTPETPVASGAMSIAGAVLDHVAVAAEAWHLTWPRYVVELGAEWSSGGFEVGFAPSQLRFANGARLEVLAPHEPARNPFLRRFLDTSGPGPHHMTFKVPDIAAALAEVEAAGFEPVQVQLSDPFWKEAFLHPRQACGVVVQLAQSAGDFHAPAPEGFPTGHPPERCSLRHVTHAVADLDAAMALFAALLGGSETARLGADDGSWEAVELTWAGPLRVRLVAGTAVADWIGQRPGRVHHLALARPTAYPGATDDGPDLVAVGPAERPAAVVGPDENLGTRLVVGRH